VPRSPRYSVQMPANAASGRFSFSANHTTSFFFVSGFGSGAYSAKLLSWTIGSCRCQSARTIRRRVVSGNYRNRPSETQATSATIKFRLSRSVARRSIDRSRRRANPASRSTAASFRTRSRRSRRVRSRGLRDAVSGHRSDRIRGGRSRRIGRVRTPRTLCEQELGRGALDALCASGNLRLRLRIALQRG
jgi:hypothetical protein